MKIRPVLLAALAATLALSACGTTDPATTEAPAEPAAGGAEPITVTDARGQQVTLEQGPAAEVVTLEWSTTEYVTSLGVQPVGVADPAGYASWASAAPLEGEPTDVGLRTEPSVESVAGLEPDLILADTSSIPEDAMTQMEEIAPVVVLNSAATDDLVGLVKENQSVVGQLLGKEAEAEALNAEFDTRLEELAGEVEAAGGAGTPMVFTYPYAASNSVDIRMHGPASAPGTLATLLGLENAWTEPGDEAYGISSSDVEGLTRLPDDTEFLYWGNEDEEDAVTSVLAENAVWQGLPFVENGRVHRAGVGIWIYGGTPSLIQFAEDITAQVTS